MQQSELPCYEKLGKTIVFSNDLPKGHKLCFGDLNVKVTHPKGTDGRDLDKFLGKILLTDVKKNDSLKLNDVI